MSSKKGQQNQIWSRESFGVCSVMALLSGLVVFSACSQWSTEWPKESSVVESDGFPQLSVQEASTKLNYSFVGRNIIGPQCARCHGNAGGVNLGDIDDIRANSDKIIEAIKPPLKKMPLGPNTMTDDDRQVLYFWLKAGAPIGQGPTPTPQPTPAPTPTPGPSFEYIHDGIFVTHGCLNCHAPGSKLGTKEPLTWEGLTAPQGDVVPGDVDNSDLIAALTGSDPLNTEPMPPAKSKEPKVSDSDIELIKEWIQNGAKEE